MRDCDGAHRPREVVERDLVYARMHSWFAGFVRRPPTGAETRREYERARQEVRTLMDEIDQITALLSSTPQPGARPR